MSAIGSIGLRLVSGDWGHMDGWGAGSWVAMVILMVLFWGLVIGGGLWLVRAVGGAPAPAPQLDAMAVLDRRLAEGEISPEEYRERQQLIERGEGALRGSDPR